MNQSHRSDPLPITDLYDDLPVYRPIIPMSEEPVNYYSHIQKLINRTKNLEQERSRNNLHKKNLLEEFSSILQATEIVAFNLVYMDLIFGADLSLADSFFKSLGEVKFLFNNPKEQDINAAANHIRFLHHVIASCTKNLSKYCAPDRINPPPPETIYQYFSSAEASLLDFQASLQNRETKTETSQIEYDLGSQNFDRCSLTENSQPFLEKLNDYLKLKEHPNEKNVENRILFGNIIHRINHIKHLKSEIDQLKKGTISPQYIESLDFSQKSLESSPFYQSVMGNSYFLLMAMKQFEIIKNQLESCNVSISKIQAKFLPLEEDRQKTKKKLDEMIAEIREFKTSKRNYLEKYYAKNEQFKDLFMNDKPQQMADLISEITSLQEEILQLLKEEAKNASEDDAAKIDILINVLQDFNSTRDGLIQLCQECYNERSDCRTHKSLFMLVSKALIVKEKQKKFEDAQTIIGKYNKALDDLSNLYQKGQIDAWCQDLNRVLDHIEELTEQRKHILETNENEQSDNIENIESEMEEMERLEREIEEMENEMKSVNQTKIELLDEIEMKKETLFDQIQMNEIYKVPEVNKKTEKYEAYKKKLTCSVCNERFCDAVINKKGCNHAFCMQCIELKGNAEGTCPKCSAHYTNDKIQPFLCVPP